jgi:hypothetical protein
MPDIPVYTREPATIVPTAFLVANDWVSTTSWVTMPEEQANAIMRGNRRLFVFGYVDYIDQFDERHRAGFGRRYEMEMKGDTNLIFMTEPGYNYDRPRKRNEGNDWNQCQ